MCHITSNMNLRVLSQRKQAKIWIMLKGKKMSLVWSLMRNDLGEEVSVGRKLKSISVLGTGTHKPRPESTEKD